ncbi:MAG: restriction endonuclease subunit S [Bacteroides sp.]|nr:restriction endonuclease subunit S [Bacteroides sp.]
MTKDNSNTRTPIIRFQGFNGEWKKKKIGDIAIVLQGYGFPEKYQGQKYGDLPFCKVGDISSAVDRGEMVINKADNFVDYSLLPVLHAQPIPVGSTIFAKIGEAIRSNKRIKTGVPCLIDNNAAAVKSKGEISDTFLFYLMSKVNLADYSGGIVPSVNKSTIEAIDVLVPSSRDEQQKIAECLEAIDQMISAQNQKVESLKVHKKGLMQQIFPQPGATTPALRFPGFTGDWQEKSFDRICHTITPPLKLQSSQYSSSGKFPIVDQSQTLICGWTNDPSGLLRNAPYIIFGDHTCVLKYIDFPFIQGADGVKILGSNKKDNSKFIYQLLLSNPVKQDGYKRHFSDLKEKVFLLPTTLEEQTKIAECLSSIDEIISVEESKVASLKAHKKGLMQQLFPQPEK